MHIARMLTNIIDPESNPGLFWALAEAAAVEIERMEGGDTRYTMKDGTALVDGPAGWDIGVHRDRLEVVQDRLIEAGSNLDARSAWTSGGHPAAKGEGDHGTD